jgi:hypothetical protein
VVVGYAGDMPDSEMEFEIKAVERVQVTVA